ncbi:MAG: hypothetical protein LBD02_00130 [Christensenellaceae bacterium]|jgi:hypothetical protein|nr:hypothetical protein [Christensenellaceae bacterium]
MADSIMNVGSGNIVNKSCGVTIKQGAAPTLDFAALEEQLTAVLACCRAARGDSSSEIPALEEAKSAAQAQEEGKLKAALKKLGGVALELAKELGLTLLADFIAQSITL